MMRAYTSGGREAEEVEGADAVWLDVFEPDASEQARIGDLAQVTLPTRTELREVESSSRLRFTEGVVYLSLPVTQRRPSGLPGLAPFGLVLTADRLITVRFDDLPLVAATRERLEAAPGKVEGAAGILVTLIETVVDEMADMLEDVGQDLDLITERVLQPAEGDGEPRSRKRHQDRLRLTLKALGRHRQLISKARATLLGIGRVPPFLKEEPSAPLPDQIGRALDGITRDVESLDEFDSHLSDKVQFLLDAVVGLISIEQNDTFRVLTVVSVVGIPPTLVASMYGMNFKHMPELDWLYGYPYGLALIAISAIAPLAYFRWRGWF